MPVRLGINTGFALNRFPEPEIWAKIVAEDLGLQSVQFTADLLNPSLPDDIIDRQIEKVMAACRTYHINIEHTFTSAFTRVNHLASPDAELRGYWIAWFKKFVDISVRLGARSMGSHLAILSVNDLQTRRVLMTKEVIKNWHIIATYAKEKGLAYLAWEPMSIPREFGETIAEAKRIHTMLNDDSPLPFKLCLDVDHGDVSSTNPDDTDPHAWIKAFGKESPIIHIKQSSRDKSGHHPFTAEYNREGTIAPSEFVAFLQKYGADDTLLLLELSFREREPYESSILEHLKESVDYWRPYIATQET